MPGDTVFVPLRGVEVGQGIVFCGVGEGGIVRQVGEGLIHHHNDVHRLAQARFVPRLPALRLSPGVALRLIHGVSGEVVAEAVGEAQLIEHGGDIVGVGHPKGVVQIVGGVDRQHQGSQKADAAGGTQKPGPPLPQLPDGEGLCLRHQRQQEHYRRHGDHQSDDGPGPADVVAAHGGAHFLQQRRVPGEYRLVPHLQLDAVGQGQYGPEAAADGGGGKHIAPQEGKAQDG